MKTETQFTRLRAQREVTVDSYEGTRTVEWVLYGDPHPPGSFLCAGTSQHEKWAQLFAASPALYAALEAITGYAARHCMDLPPGLAALCVDGERALARARGENPATTNKNTP